MKVTPLDLRQQQFRTVFRGYDRAEVAAFLSEIAEDYEQALRESDRLQQDLKRMEAVLNEHREHERNLRNTLLTAQRLSDGMRENAEQEGQRIVREAEGKADLLLQRTQAHIGDLAREINDLKLRRSEVETSLEATISSLRSSLDSIREQDQREREEKILIHRPRTSDSAQSESREGTGPWTQAQS